MIPCSFVLCIISLGKLITPESWPISISIILFSTIFVVNVFFESAEMSNICLDKRGENCMKSNRKSGRDKATMSYRKQKMTTSMLGVLLRVGTGLGINFLSALKAA